MNSVFIVTNGHIEEFYGAYFENVAAFSTYEAAEEFKIKAELLHERNKEIRKRFHDFMFKKGLGEEEAAKRASDSKMTVEEINELDLSQDEWEIEEVQFVT